MGCLGSTPYKGSTTARYSEHSNGSVNGAAAAPVPGSRDNSRHPTPLPPTTADASTPTANGTGGHHSIFTTSPMVDSVLRMPRVTSVDGLMPNLRMPHFGRTATPVPDRRNSDLPMDGPPAARRCTLFEYYIIARDKQLTPVSPFTVLTRPCTHSSILGKR